MTPSIDDIPVCPADPDELRRLAASVEAAGSATKPSADRILFTWGLLSSVYRSPEAPELQQSLRLLDPAAAEIDLACAARDRRSRRWPTTSRP